MYKSQKSANLFGFSFDLHYLSPLVKVLSFEKVQIKFGFLLTYSYLCSPKV